MAALDLGTDQLIAEIVDGVGWIEFNQPARRNALSAQMAQALPRALAAFADDAAVRAVVMRGSGDRAFISGGDLVEMGTEKRTPGAPSAGAVDRLVPAEFPKPVIAMIRGYCLGAGVMVALSADLRIAADDAQLGIPAARLGVGYPYEAAAALVQVVGPAAASEILLTGDRFDAQRALALGLVNRVVPAAKLEDEVRALAAQLAANAPLTLRAAKASIRCAASGGDPDAVRPLIARCWQSEDFAEGRTAFAERRTPVFRGA